MGFPYGTFFNGGMEEVYSSENKLVLFNILGISYGFNDMVAAGDDFFIVFGEPGNGNKSAITVNPRNLPSMLTFGTRDFIGFNKDETFFIVPNADIQGFGDSQQTGPANKLRTIISNVYQICGEHDVSERILDVLVDPDNASALDVEDMIPYSLDRSFSGRVKRAFNVLFNKV